MILSKNWLHVYTKEGELVVPPASSPSLRESCWKTLYQCKGMFHDSYQIKQQQFQKSKNVPLGQHYLHVHNEYLTTHLFNPLGFLVGSYLSRRLCQLPANTQPLLSWMKASLSVSFQPHFKQFIKSPVMNYWLKWPDC